MRKVLMILAVAMMVFTLTACETMKGLGRDVEDAGAWVQKKAN